MSRAARSTPKAQPAARARGVQRGEGDAGAGGDLAGGGIDRAERVEAAQRQHDGRRWPAGGHAAADQAGVAALGHDGDAVRSSHQASTAATSSTDPGRTTADAVPTKRPVQSCS